MSDKNNSDLGKITIECQPEYTFAGMHRNVTYNTVTGAVYDTPTGKQIGYGKVIDGILHVYRGPDSKDN